MDEWIKGLWANNKLVFFLILPIVLIILFRSVIIDLLIGSAHKVADEAKKQDDVLKDEFNKLNNEADQLKNQTPNVDESWNTKK